MPHPIHQARDCINCDQPSSNGDTCDVCAAEGPAGVQAKGADFVAAKLAGRCANGMERGQGAKLHAIPSTQVRVEYNEAYGSAICGATPGRRSVGWTVLVAEAVTCPRCIRALARVDGAQ